MLNHQKLPELIRRMQRPGFYPHPVSRIELIETHISWVILTGQFAYKVKRPVDLGFLDFSTLEKRRRACEDELRLNMRLAPELYLQVIAITGTAAAPLLGGAGPPIEFALKMHEFPQQLQLDRLLNSQSDDANVMSAAFSQFGERLACFHAGLPPADNASSFGGAQAACAAALGNFSHFGPLGAAAELAQKLSTMHEWTRKRCKELKETLRARKAGGFVRECHGDLHLRNLVLLDNHIVPFDCIEFSAELRWIDIMSDVAFLFMDLLFHERDMLAYIFLNAWLSSSGDYAGLGLLRFYAVYRAMVRAKIAGIELVQEDWPSRTADPAVDEHLADLNRHLDLAAQLRRGTGALLIITHGVSGSGKTWLASRLANQLGAVHVRSDVERKRLFGMAARDRSSARQKSRVYGEAANRQTYEHLLSITQEVFNAGLPVIADATFLDKHHRTRFARLARAAGLAFVILDCQADTDTLHRRVEARQRQDSDASEADRQILAAQLQTGARLDSDELECSITVDTGGSIDLPGLVQRLDALRRHQPPA